MPKPLVYEIVPSSDKWVLRIAGDSLSEVFDDKAEALSSARRLAARHEGLVRVLAEGGRVEAEYAPPRPGARS